MISTALALVTSAALLAPPAEACLNDVQEGYDARVAQVRRAEGLVARGRFAQALRLASSVARAEWHDDLLLARAHLVRAVATARLGGAVDLTRGTVVRRASDEQRALALQQALEILDARRQVANDPVLRARRAEVLAQQPGREGDARAILEELASADLMPDAWGWRALEILRRAAGDGDSGDEAAQRCRSSAGRLAPSICPHRPNA